jgi:uncharacterized protein YkwD
MRRLALAVATLVLVIAAGGSGARAEGARGSTPAAGVRWSNVTGARLAPLGGGPDAALYRACGARDLGLVRVATALLQRRMADKAPFADSELKELTRRAGVPHPWPRAWVVTGVEGETELVERFSGWLGQRRARGAARCGLARGATAGGQDIVAAVVVDALADMEALPRQVRASAWQTLDARLLVAADEGAKVVLLGPQGRPRRVLTSTSDDQVRSRFTLDAPGRWLVQVVANLEGGPTPVLEAVVFVDVPPRAPVKSERRAGRRATLSELLARARKREGAGALRHDEALARAAELHARAMMRSGKVAHDLGAGGPEERAMGLGIRARRIGENVASAPTVERLHRALWDSPSHRENMLDGRFKRFGSAIVQDERGRLWAVQLFAE